MPLAHSLSALSVLFAIRSNRRLILLSGFFLFIAFSVYQSVAANALTLFLIWMLVSIVFDDRLGSVFLQPMVRSIYAFSTASFLAGIGYISSVLLLGISLSSYQGADKAFDFNESVNMDISYFFNALYDILTGSRSFYFWPENYFPLYLKYAQLIFLFTAAALCVYLPRNTKSKIAAVLIFSIALIAPRFLQLLHSEGQFHNLTLTAYALVVSACIAIVLRTGKIILRNLTIVTSIFIIAGYIEQCNWISSINYLNSQAHYATLTQILARIRSLEDKESNWDGKKAFIFGSYEMPEYRIFKKAAGVAPNFIRPQEIQDFSHVLRDEMIFLNKDQVSPRVIQFVSERPSWPHPASAIPLS